MRLEIISFKTCPYLHRARILLLEKDVGHEVSYLPQNSEGEKPDWFYEFSPRGTAPVLIADGAPIVESSAICEFIDETTEMPPLMPADPLHRARDRAWFAVASEDFFGPLRELTIAPERQSVQEHTEKLRRPLERLNEAMWNRRWLSGEGTRFGMADIAMAPFLYRAAWLRQQGLTDLLSPYPHVYRWTDQVLARPAMAHSVPKDFMEESLREMQSRHAWLLNSAAA